MPSVVNAEAVANSELIRASVIEKIAGFIQWPDSNQGPMNLCVYANTSLLPALETYYASSDTDNNPIKLFTAKNFKSFSECHILYLGVGENARLEDILQTIASQPVLIITEKRDDVSRGAHVDFFVEDNRLRLEVNRAALSKNNLKASYHLLGAARIVE